MKDLTKIDQIIFGKDRAIIFLYINNNSFLNDKDNDVTFRNSILEQFPNILNHDCINAFGPKFKDCFYRTNYAHIFEHALIELLNRNDVTKKHRYFGFTRLIKCEESYNKYRIEISFYDDIEFLRTIDCVTSTFNKEYDLAIKQEKAR